MTLYTILKSRPTFITICTIHTNCETKISPKAAGKVKPTSGVFFPGLHLPGHRWLVCECPSASRSYGRLTGRPLCE